MQYQSLQRTPNGEFIVPPLLTPLGPGRRKAMRQHHHLRVQFDPDYRADIDRRKTEQYFKRNPLAVGA